MAYTPKVMAVVALLGCGAGFASAGELKPETVDAWQQYIQAAESQMRLRADSAKPFLWADEQLGRAARLRSGELLVEPVAVHGAVGVPDGLIHDWVGAVFIPNANVSDVRRMLHDYDRYKDIYQPGVVDSHFLGKTAGGETEFSLRMAHKALFVTAAIDGRYREHQYELGPQRAYDVSWTTRVEEIREFRQPGEHVLPPDQGSGFIWRLFSIARYEERDGGVYVELRAIALSRDIPASLRWLVRPVVNRLSRDSLMVSLNQTRGALSTRRDFTRTAPAKGNGLNPGLGLTSAFVSGNPTSR